MVLSVLTLLCALGSTAFAFLAWRKAHAPQPKDDALHTSLAHLSFALERVHASVREEIARNREESSKTEREQRKELTEQFEKVRLTLENKIKDLQESNTRKLEEMRHTVDEKLQGALEKRLSESFKQVSERLEQVHKGLGEMQTLATGVGDLKRVLTNVKTRGTWGEVQLANLLEQFLSPDQYEKNVATLPNSRDRVEFAVRFPSRDENGGPILMPLDSKFPQEDYERLVLAQERGDQAAAEEAIRALELAVKKNARDICEKYIAAPHTTEFGIMFLPTEGLYAEILRRPGLSDFLQREHKIVIAGPTNLAALLSSFQMGFRTLAIEKRSSEVWQVLGAVKTEFNKFGDILDRVGKKLQEAQNTIEDASRKTRNISTKLRKVEALPEADAQILIGMEEAETGSDLSN